MVNQIYLPKKIAENKQVIRVNGVCYYKVGPSPEVPNEFDVEQVYVDCSACETDGSSSGEPCDVTCMEYVSQTSVDNSTSPTPPLDLNIVSCNWIGDSQICVGDLLEIEFTITNISGRDHTFNFAPRIEAVGFTWTVNSTNPTSPPQTVITTNTQVLWADRLTLTNGQTLTYSATMTLDTTGCPGTGDKILKVIVEKLEEHINLKCKECP